MTPLDEQLSRLWDGDLPPAEAEALRARIASDPEVARRWERLGSAMAALAALPAELTPPPLRARPPARRSFAGLVPWAIAAAAVALWIRTLPAPDRVLVDGTEWVDGEAVVHAGDVAVEVDGRATIAVEPPGGVPRGGGADEEDPMGTRSNVVAALAGAAVTVVVYEGTAVVRAESGGAAPVVVEAGDTYRTGGAPAPRAAGGAAPSADEGKQERVARLLAELEAVQKALAEAEFEGALTRGQLEAMQGTVSEWPSDAPEPLTPDAFRQGLEAAVASIPNARVAELDCAEYPCLAAVQFTGDGPSGEWFRTAEDGVKAWLDGMGLEQVSLSVNTSHFRDDQGHDESYLVFGAHTSDQDDVGTRTEYRMDGLVDELGSRLGEEP